MVDPSDKTVLYLIISVLTYLTCSIFVYNRERKLVATKLTLFGVYIGTYLITFLITLDIVHKKCAKYTS